MSYIGQKPADKLITSSDMEDGIVTTAKIADSSVTTEKIVADTNFRNIIINGDMSIAQRGTSVSGIGNGDSGYHTVDRWKFFENGATTAEFTQSQSTDVPSGQGFATSLKMDCTTADASLGADDGLRISQQLEGQNLQYLKYGTSNAVSLTASFWVKSNKTGNYNISLYNEDQVRIIGNTYTINTANTWEKKTITFAGDTASGEDFDNDNNSSLWIWFGLGSGTNLTGGDSSSWSSLSNDEIFAGQVVNLADSTDNELYITGVQLEAGTTASDFEFLPVDINLQRCQRYCYTYANYSSGDVSGNRAFSSQYAVGSMVHIPYPTQLRANPTISYGITGGTIDSPQSNISQLQEYDANDLNFWLYDVIAEAEL
jgi:hypothetical protein